VARNARRQETNKTKRRPHRLGVVAVQGRSLTPIGSDAAGAAGGTGSVSADHSPPPQCHSPLQLLSDEQRDLISLLVAYQDKYDLPTDDDIRKVSVGLTLSIHRVSPETFVVSLWDSQSRGCSIPTPQQVR